MTVKDIRSLSSEAQTEIRLRVVEAVKQGPKQREVAEIFGVSYQSVSIWVKRDKQKGSKALQSKQKGRPVASGRKMIPWQERQIPRLVIGRHPE